MSELVLLAALVVATLGLGAIVFAALPRRTRRPRWGSFLLWAVLFVAAIVIGLVLNAIAGGR